MKGKVAVYILFLYIASFKSFALQAELPVDTVMKRAMSAAEKYNDLVESFSAEIYTRTYVETVKKNFLYKYTHLIPRFVLHDPYNEAAVIETISDLRFDYPNNYVQDIRHVTGTLTAGKDIDMIPFELLNINIYGESTNDESFFMPIRFNTSKYYRYNLTRTFTENEKTYYSINFNPIYENSKLLKGTFIIERGTWRVIFFRGEGIDIFSDFSFEMTMGDEWITNYLPVRFTIYETASYLGNVLASRHLATINYQEVRLRQSTEPVRSLNISDFYKVRLGPVPLQSDSTFWNERRPIPLQARERDVLAQHLQQQAEEATRKAGGDSLRSPNIAQQVAQRMVMNSNYKYRSTAIGYSGLLNPLMVGYTSRDGITYRQKLSFNFDLKRNRTVKMDAFAGYMFHRKEFFTDLTTTWNYEPYRLGSASVSIGNGNPIYSSLFVDQIQDSLNNRGINFDEISVNYYRDYYLKLFNTYEMTNGMLLQTGIDYHIRKSKGNMSKLRSTAPDSEPIEDMFGVKKSFAPFVRISWTPRQYYRYDGRQKIYERSPFPTFKLELSRSFQHILGSTSEYNRVELDISQNIPFGLRHSLQYHLGAGKFIDQKTEYFADFVYFSKSNFPENWDDGLGGIFNLLGRELYNASDSYIQAHIMFEAPFLILKNIPFVSDFAENERIYLSQLHTPQIVSYTELGYGIGNRFFNAGAFCSFHKTALKQLGVRAAFEF
ncbi:MAG: DUF5686 family protein [Proteiniphilum sp.]|jgi:hypothetical protein|nr:DUF5686 family protein [Proteiniphilum sp.]